MLVLIPSGGRYRASSEIPAYRGMLISWGPIFWARATQMVGYFANPDTPLDGRLRPVDAKDVFAAVTVEVSNSAVVVRARQGFRFPFQECQLLVGALEFEINPFERWRGHAGSSS
jgi:hypothetical protein